MRFRYLIVPALAASRLLAQAPAPHPGPRLLRLTSDSLEVSVVRVGQAQRTGYIVDRLDTVRVNGETVLRRVLRMSDSVLGNGVDTLIDAFATLQPRLVRSRSDRGNERMDWGPTRVVGVVEEPEAPARSVDSPRPSGWYSSTSFDLILRASPLDEGYVVSVPTFSGRQGSHVMTAHVVGSDTIDGHGDSWRIDADFAGLPVTLWVDKASRRLVRQVMHVSPVLEIMFSAPKRGGPSA